MEKQVNIYRKFLEAQEEMQKSFTDNEFLYEEHFFLKRIVFILNVKGFYLSQIIESVDNNHYILLCITHETGALFPLGKLEINENVNNVNILRHLQISVAFGLGLAKLNKGEQK